MLLQKTSDIKELLLLYKNCLLTEEMMTQNLAPVVNEVAKMEGRSYFKLPLTDIEPSLAKFLFKTQTTCNLPITKEEQFFIDYIIKKQERKKKYHQNQEISYLAGFPVIYYQDKKKNANITPLFRFDLHTVTFPLVTKQNAPSSNEQGQFSLTENNITLSQHNEEESLALSYWLNDIFCMETLGFQEEDVRNFRNALTISDRSCFNFLSLFCQHIIKEPFEDANPNRIFSFVANQLTSFFDSQNIETRKNIKIYPYALVFEKSNVNPTRQLLNDIEAIIDDNIYPTLSQDHPFKSLLLEAKQEEPTKQEKETEEPLPIVVPYNEKPLTHSQLKVIQSLEKERLVTVEGPPGTGKTHLIRNVATNRFVEWVNQIDSIGYMPDNTEHFTLITSTNNRAVDNAIEVFFKDNNMPISLRVGSRLVIAKVTLRLFYSYIEQLEQVKVVQKTEEFYQEKKHFQEAYAQLYTDAKQELDHSLYEQARKVHSLWVYCNKRKVMKLLSSLIEDIEKERGLSRLFWGNQMPFFSAIFPIIGTTLLSLRNTFALNCDKLGLVIIDEAGQCSPSYVLPAFYRSKQALIVGDTKQLEPIGNLYKEEILNLCSKQKLQLTQEQIQFFLLYVENNRSIQSIAEALRKPNRLTDHFRSRKEIMELSNQLGSYNMVNHKKEKEYSFPAFQYVNHSFNETPYGNSWKNEQEVQLVIQVVQQLRKDGYSLSDITLLTPYKGQWQALNQALYRLRIPVVSEDIQDSKQALLTGTVHQMQGGEKPIIIFSNVLRNRPPLFLNEKVNLLNVAISRAKDSFIFIGSLSNLTQGEYTSVLHATLLDKGTLVTL